MAKTILLFLCLSAAVAVARPAVKPETMTWTIDGAERRALVYAPSKTSRGKVPLVFAFHGGGDNIEHFSITDFQGAWPQAVIVYMQGRERETGGGSFVTNDPTPANPDLKFFDSVLADMHQTFRIDDTRIYAAGFSNGARFVYLLWAARSSIFAAFAPVAGTIAPQLELKEPKSVIHIGGREDHNVEFSQQMETIEVVRKLNNAIGNGETCGKDCTLYRSPKGAPVITLLHSGGHLYPSAATDIIVTFFKAHP